MIRGFGKRVRQFRESFYYYPTIGILLACVGFVATTLLDRNLQHVFPGFEDTPWAFLVFTGNPQAARSVLAAIATMWATITGVVYSVTLVTVQLGATKYTAEVIPRFERDRTNRLVLALYAATVAYSLLVLKTVRVEQPGTFAPVLGVNAAIVLALLALFALGVFISNLTSYIRPKRFVDDLSDAAIREAAARYDAHDVHGGVAFSERLAPPVNAFRLRVPAREEGYALRVDEVKLRDAVRRVPGGSIVRLRARPGRRVDPGAPVFDVFLPPHADANGKDVVSAKHALSAAVGVGPSRTLEEDPRLAVDTLGEIGVTTLLGPTDIAVAERCIQGLLRIARWEATREDPPRGFAWHGVPVDLGQGPLTPSVLRYANQVHAAALTNDVWVITEVLVDETATLVEQFEDPDHHPERRRLVLEFLEDVLVTAFQRVDPDDVLTRLVRRVGELESDLRECGQRTLAADVRQVLEEAAARARRHDPDALGPHASRALEVVRDAA